MRLAVSAAACAAALSTLAAFAVLGGSVSAAPGDVAVTMKNFDFQPMSVAVPVGAAVTWTNLDGEPHTVTSVDGLFRSGALDQGDHFTFRFAKPGVYAYLCSIHPRMRATV